VQSQIISQVYNQISISLCYLQSCYCHLRTKINFPKTKQIFSKKLLVNTTWLIGKISYDPRKSCATRTQERYKLTHLTNDLRSWNRPGLCVYEYVWTRHSHVPPPKRKHTQMKLHTHAHKHTHKTRCKK
jgi:hypothetical protein